MADIADIFAVEDGRELDMLRRIAKKFTRRLEAYVGVLRRDFAVRDLPTAVVWTSRRTAAEYLSSIPVPAYTNDCRIVFCPILAEWRELYLAQLVGLTGPEAEEVRGYYLNTLSENNLLQILGHELVHHSEYFSDADYDRAPWFEEGMAEYISRRLLLTAAEFDAEERVNRLLVKMPVPERAGQNRAAGIFAPYRKSFLRVSDLIARRGGDVRTVLSSGAPDGYEGEGSV